MGAQARALDISVDRDGQDNMNDGEPVPIEQPAKPKTSGLPIGLIVGASIVIALALLASNVIALALLAIVIIVIKSRAKNKN